MADNPGEPVQTLALPHTAPLDATGGRTCSAGDHLDDEDHLVRGDDAAGFLFDGAARGPGRHADCPSSSSVGQPEPRSMQVWVAEAIERASARAAMSGLAHSFRSGTDQERSKGSKAGFLIGS